MKGRQQLISPQPEGFPNEADVVINQRLGKRTLVRIPVQAGGKGLAETDAVARLAELLGDAQHEGGFTAEGLTGSDQQGRSHRPQMRFSDKRI